MLSTRMVQIAHRGAAHVITRAAVGGPLLTLSLARCGWWFDTVVETEDAAHATVDGQLEQHPGCEWCLLHGLEG